MRTAVITVAAILLGLAVTVFLAIAVEYVSSLAHPFPEDFGGTPEEVARHVERYPPEFLAAVVPAWAAAAFAGTWTARRLGTVPAGVVVGLIVVALVALNLAMLPYPSWFKVACLLAVPAAALLALGVVGKRAFGRKSGAAPSGS